jgi:VCBS repeat-containing protein
LKYDPFPDFHGTETITYSVPDGRDVSSSATVTITVAPVNDAPRAFEDAITFGFNAQVSVYASTGFVLGSSGQSVLWNDDDVDGDTLSAELVSQPSYGTVQLESDGTFSYAPPATAAADLANSPYFVYTSFTYEADDGNGGTSGPTTVHLWLKGPVGSHETDQVSTKSI